MKKFMLSLLLIFLASASLHLFFIQQAEADDEKASPINLSEPPFWMFSYDELKDLKENQKSFYLKNIEAELKKISTLGKVTEDFLIEASQWYERWNILQRKVSRACLEKQSTNTCSKLARLRLQTLDLRSNQKLENRRASK